MGLALAALVLMGRALWSESLFRLPRSRLKIVSERAIERLRDLSVVKEGGVGMRRKTRR